MQVQNDLVALFASQERFPEVFACREAVTCEEEALAGLLPTYR